MTLTPQELAQRAWEWNLLYDGWLKAHFCRWFKKWTGQDFGTGVY